MIRGSCKTALAGLLIAAQSVQEAAKQMAEERACRETKKAQLRVRSWY